MKLLLKGLWRSRQYSLVVIITLGLGIGGSTLIFSMIAGLLFSPLPYAPADRIVLVQPAPSWDLFEALQSQSRVFAELAAYNERTVTVSGIAEPERTPIGRVTPRFFQLTGVQASVGRLFTREEFETQHDVVLVSHRLSRKWFGGTQDALGRTINLDGRPHTIVGVLPPSFKTPPELPAARATTIEWGASLIVPMLGDPRVVDLWGTDYGWRGISLLARLRDGVPIDQARAEVRAVATKLSSLAYRRDQLSVVSLADYARGNLSTHLAIVAAAVVLLLLAACLNVVNLELARWASRSQELATRLALGALPRHLLLQTVCESLVLAACGGIIGCWIAWAGGDAARLLAGDVLSGLDAVVVDTRVLAFACVLCVATGVLVGAVPGIVAPMMAVWPALKNARAESGRAASLRSALVIAQVALAVIVVVCGALLTRDFLRLSGTDLGFRPAGVLAAEIAASPREYPAPAQRTALFREILQRAAALPGVTSVGFTNHLPAGATNGFVSMGVEGVDRGKAGTDQQESLQSCEIVFGDYFKTISLPALAGRVLNQQDLSTAERVAVINESLQRKFWRNAEAALEGRIVAGGTSYRVVGVVRDVRRMTAQSDAHPIVYFPYEQFPGAAAKLTMVLKTTRSVAGLSEDLRRVVRQVSPSLPLYNVMTLEHVARSAVARRRVVAALILVFGALSLLMAVVGVYGAVAASVVQRRHEMGVRLVLGAVPVDVYRLTISRGMRLVVVGIAAGLPLALCAAFLIASQLVAVKPADFTSCVVSVVVVTACGLVGCIVPAVAAMRLDPLACVRDE